jgi:hypothetical protein
MEKNTMIYKTYPLSRNQCYHWQGYKDWNLLPSGLHVHGSLNYETLKSSILNIMSRQESLRTVLRENENAVFQVVLPDIKLDISFIDACCSKESSDVKSLIHQSLKKKIDFTNGPLFRIMAFKTSPDDYLLVGVFHHLIVDALSIGLFWKEVFQAYESLIKTHAISLPPIRKTYKNYVEWEASFYSQKVLQEKIENFNASLPKEDLFIPLPYDIHPKSLINNQSKTISILIDTHKKYEIFCQEHHATPFSLIYASWNILLHLLSDKTSLSTLIPVYNSKFKGAKNTIGFFANTIFNTVTLTNDMLLQDLLQQGRRSVILSMNQALPLKELRETIRAHDEKYAHKKSPNPFVNGKFTLTYLDSTFNDVSTTNKENLTFQFVTIERMHTHCELFLIAQRNPKSLTINFEYLAGLFHDSTIQRWIKGYEKIFHYVLENPYRTLSDLKKNVLL